jgi:hypothetical protein
VTKAKPERDAPPDPEFGARAEPARDSALFELDTPGLDSPASNAAISGTAPANSNSQNPAPLTIDVEFDAEGERLAQADATALDEELQALADSPALPDSDAAALTVEELLAAQAATSGSPASTRAATHVLEAEQFDNLLDSSPPSEADARMRLAWRFKATSAAYRLLGPLAPMADRSELVALLRNYELSLRAAVIAPLTSSKQLTDALHLALPAELIDELERSLAKVEDKLLGIDECVADEAFRMRWNKERETPKALLRYARLLAARRFNIGYRRDRFEALAQELLTAKTSAGLLLLMPRAKAGPVLRQLLRGLPRAANTREERAAAHSYLRDALDRLHGLTGAKQFFASGFFLDVHGYKVSMHDHVSNPEFLYLCVALSVEIHNRFHAWSRPSAERDQARGSTPPLAALQAQLRAQEQAVQGVFSNFRKPRELPGAATATQTQAKKPTRPKAASKARATGGIGLFGFAAAALFLLVALGANLFTTGVVRLQEAPEVLMPAELHALSGLLLQGKLSAKRTRFEGWVARPAWQRMPAVERRSAAQALAANLERQGIHHAHVYAYKTRAIEVEFGGVVYVDDAR